MHPTHKKWHDYLDSKDPEILKEILAEDVTFHSPVVHTPQQGKKITFIYLSAALHLLSGHKDRNFRYVNEVTNDRHLHLEFECTLDGILVNGIDLIELNKEGKITKFKVMLRPLQAINIVHKKMGEMLARGKK